MEKYQQGKIYKIVGNGETYYGSTCQATLAKRLTNHRSAYKYYMASNDVKGYCSSFKCFEKDNDNYEIILVEDYPCENKDQLRMRERHHIDKDNTCVNIKKPIITEEEHNQH